MRDYGSTLARPDYLLAMKLRAMRAGTRDEADAAMLARASGIVTASDMEGLLRRYFPQQPPDPRRLATIKQFAGTLHDTPPNLAG